MYKPELYQKSNSAPSDDAIEALQQFKSKINWRDEDSAVDLGCGDGNLTVNILKKRMPPNYKKLLGCDIGEKMVHFANKHHSDMKTSFCVFDIGGDLSSELTGTFNHVFSFYAIHWIRNQEKAFKNVYDLLAQGGDCLLVFPAYTPIHDFYRILARHTKWRPWLRDVENYVSPYQNVEEPQEKVRNIMAKMDFKNIDVRCENKSYINDIELFRRTIEAICPFKIPPELYEEFMDDYMKVVREMGLVIENGEQAYVKIQYRLIVAFGKK